MMARIEKLVRQCIERLLEGNNNNKKLHLFISLSESSLAFALSFASSLRLFCFFRISLLIYLLLSSASLTNKTTKSLHNKKRRYTIYSTPPPPPPKISLPTTRMKKPAKSTPFSQIRKE
jgi:hypothetical protein